MQYATITGTATSGVDYTGVRGTFTIQTGNTTGLLFINAIQDTIYEGNETYSIILSSPSTGIIADAT